MIEKHGHLRMHYFIAAPFTQQSVRLNANEIPFQIVCSHFQWIYLFVVRYKVLNYNVLY